MTESMVSPTLTDEPGNVVSPLVATTPLSPVDGVLTGGTSAGVVVVVVVVEVEVEVEVEVVPAVVEVVEVGSVVLEDWSLPTAAATFSPETMMFTSCVDGCPTTPKPNRAKTPAAMVISVAMPPIIGSRRNSASLLAIETGPSTPPVVCLPMAHEVTCWRCSN